MWGALLTKLSITPSLPTNSSAAVIKPIGLDLQTKPKQANTLSYNFWRGWELEGFDAVHTARAGAKGGGGGLSHASRGQPALEMKKAGEGSERIAHQLSVSLRARPYFPITKAK